MYFKFYQSKSTCLFIVQRGSEFEIKGRQSFVGMANCFDHIHVLTTAADPGFLEGGV